MDSSKLTWFEHDPITWDEETQPANIDGNVEVYIRLRNDTIYDEEQKGLAQTWHWGPIPDDPNSEVVSFGFVNPADQQEYEATLCNPPLPPISNEDEIENFGIF